MYSLLHLPSEIPIIIPDRHISKDSHLLHKGAGYDHDDLVSLVCDYDLRVNGYDKNMQDNWDLCTLVLPENPY